MKSKTNSAESASFLANRLIKLLGFQERPFNRSTEMWASTAPDIVISPNNMLQSGWFLHHRPEEKVFISTARISIIIQTFAIYIFEMTAFVLLLCIVLSELLSFSLASVLIVRIDGFSFE